MYQSILSFCKGNGFVAISDVRVNRNGYPFCTFVTGDSKGENIYFSKGSSALVAEGDPAKVLKDLDLQIAETKNADGEIRFKLSRASGEGYASVASLFG